MLACDNSLVVNLMVSTIFAKLDVHNSITYLYMTPPFEWYLIYKTSML